MKPSLSKDQYDKARSAATDRLFVAIYDFVFEYGFEAMVTVVGAGIVAAAEMKDSMPEPQKPIVRESHDRHVVDPPTDYHDQEKFDPNPF